MMNKVFIFKESGEHENKHLTASLTKFYTILSYRVEGLSNFAFQKMNLALEKFITLNLRSQVCVLLPITTTFLKS